jgi:hypothetical protein
VTRRLNLLCWSRFSRPPALGRSWSRAREVALAERVRDLLGVGSVSVSVGSGIAPVTIVVGKDFSG